MKCTESVIFSESIFQIFLDIVVEYISLTLSLFFSLFFVKILKFFNFKFDIYLIIFFRYEGRTSFLVFSGGPYCIYSTCVAYFNRLRLYTADSGYIDSSYVFCRTGNGADSNQSRQVLQY